MPGSKEAACSSLDTPPPPPPGHLQTQLMPPATFSTSWRYSRPCHGSILLPWQSMLRIWASGVDSMPQHVAVWTNLVQAQATVSVSDQSLFAALLWLAALTPGPQGKTRYASALTYDILYCASFYMRMGCRLLSLAGSPLQKAIASTVCVTGIISWQLRAAVGYATKKVDARGHVQRLHCLAAVS